MNKEKEKILEELKVKRSNLQEKLPQNIVIQNIKLLGSIQLTEKETEKEEGSKIAKLYLVEEYNKETDEIILKYYADDEFIGIANEGEFIPTGLAREKYDNTNSIKDVLENLEEKEEIQKDAEGKGKIQEVYDLNELEQEKEQEEKDKGKDGKKSNKEDKRSVVGKEPEGVIQKIDPHKTYVNSVETVSNAFEISSEVDEIAIADTQDGDENALSDDKTIYMLDKDDKIIEESNGKKIDELFEYDDATGNNPMSDKNIKTELDGHAEINKNQTIARFESKEKPGKHVTAVRGGLGKYNGVYAGEKTRNGNIAVEVQLETDNVEIQTSLEPQKVNDYGEGDYEKEKIAKEVEKHQKHGDDEGKIAIENADGEESTRVACESPFVPDTNITWEQFSKSVGDRNIEELQKDFFEQYNGNNGQELILKIQADYKEKENCKQTEEIDRRDNEDEEGPWRYAGSRERKH